MASRLSAVAGLFCLLFLAGGGAACGYLADDEQALRAARNMGLKDVRIEDRSRWAVSLQGCDEKDVAKFDVSGVNAQGERVTLVVCSSWPFKGATIRTP